MPNFKVKLCVATFGEREKSALLQTIRLKYQEQTKYTFRCYCWCCCLQFPHSSGIQKVFGVMVWVCFMALIANFGSTQLICTSVQTYNMNMLWVIILFSYIALNSIATNVHSIQTPMWIPLSCVLCRAKKKILFIMYEYNVFLLPHTVNAVRVFLSIFTYTRIAASADAVVVDSDRHRWIR